MLKRYLSYFKILRFSCRAWERINKKYHAERKSHITHFQSSIRVFPKKSLTGFQFRFKGIMSDRTVNNRWALIFQNVTWNRFISNKMSQISIPYKPRSILLYRPLILIHYIEIRISFPRAPFFYKIDLDMSIWREPAFIEYYHIHVQIIFYQSISEIYFKGSIGKLQLILNISSVTMSVTRTFILLFPHSHFIIRQFCSRRLWTYFVKK